MGYNARVRPGKGKSEASRTPLPGKEQCRRDYPVHMNPFVLLRDPATYKAEEVDLVTDEAAREYWLSHFQKHFHECMKYAADEYGKNAGNQIDEARTEFSGLMSQLSDDPTSLPCGELSVITLDRLREEVLRKNGLRDPYRKLKRRLNEEAAELFPQVCRKLHAMKPDQRYLHLVECIFAGNMHDLGSENTMHLTGSPTEFLQQVEQSPDRPWLVDDFDLLLDDFVAVPPMWAKAVLFIDNAGADFILGMMPLAREMALRGTAIVLAANEEPALNDMTVDETVEFVQLLAMKDPDLDALIQGGWFEVVSTGSTIPLLDLSNVSDELNAAAEDAELVVLEGMGRAVETNYNAEFISDSLRLARIKSGHVADRLGGKTFDCVCKYVQVDLPEEETEGEGEAEGEAKGDLDLESAEG